MKFLRPTHSHAIRLVLKSDKVSPQKRGPTTNKEKLARAGERRTHPVSFSLNMLDFTLFTGVVYMSPLPWFLTRRNLAIAETRHQVVSFPMDTITAVFDVHFGGRLNSPQRSSSAVSGQYVIGSSLAPFDIAKTRGGYLSQNPMFGMLGLESNLLQYKQFLHCQSFIFLSCPSILVESHHFLFITHYLCPLPITYPVDRCSLV